MAGGVSRNYARNWAYEKEGTRFEDTVGNILSRGQDLRATFKAQALQTAKQAIAFENEQTSKEPTQLRPEFLHQTSGEKKQGVDMRGYVWVDPKGNTVAPASTKSFSDLPAPPTPRSELPHERQRAAAYMDSTSRSMHLWRKVNPGCMEVTTQLPPSTYDDHFAFNPEEVKPLQKEYYRKKNDFTAYADQRIRYNQGAEH